MLQDGQRKSENILQDRVNITFTKYVLLSVVGKHREQASSQPDPPEIVSHATSFFHTQTRSKIL